jgi:ADP-ribose pyrophosphatase
MQPWKTLSRRTILNQGKYLIVENHAIELPDGHVITNWPWLITPDYVNILAITGKDEFLCLRQTKYAVVGTSLAPVGGYLEPGEEPLAAARRELLEETGYQASEWIDLGHYVVDGNRGAGTAHLFLACGAERMMEPNPDDLEEQELLCLSRSELDAALDAGDFKLLSWAAVVALALRYIDKEF